MQVVVIVVTTVSKRIIEIYRQTSSVNRVSPRSIAVRGFSSTGIIVYSDYIALQILLVPEHVPVIPCIRPVTVLETDRRTNCVVMVYYNNVAGCLRYKKISVVVVIGGDTVNRLARALSLIVIGHSVGLVAYGCTYKISPLPNERIVIPVVISQWVAYFVVGYGVAGLFCKG